MASLNVEIVELKEKVVYGLWKQSNDKTISNDIDTLSEEYYNTICSTKGMVLPYIVLSRNYDETSKDFEMFIGSTIENNGLKSFTLPAGKYAKVTIKPKLGLFWGASIGEAKRYFYIKWLPTSQYQGMNMEYEFHTEKSKDKHPTIDIIFAIKEKN
ncbi:GyrI-like domain-containing protein [Clostridium sporogenes]|uniref:GyrI-like domain-containing protein n=1 Tax=Clostridium sporogenes TaxID=1509 RepID=UPI0013D22FF2|nr:effector binding domain-containing protein [Clostridium sporogenes]MBA4510063.1 GyrI-like domain-containing protein [Clostridium sporogenes]MCW6059831.1 GyrI-like domain-containing protein [Clostridium sporogenes]MCW6067216.1 GyrI-like domain-containing protein [Clostridium sporogenes]MDU6337490.1 effector binding domain-containing protein [Clostridium sporogenes]NFQ85830.1 GyrI-like domain-containing protein [Clostridium sporogenes]